MQTRPSPPDRHFPLVSIRIPSFNHRQFVEQALDSVIQDSYPNKELVIIDDGSTDDSAAVISRWIDTNGHRIAVNYSRHPRNLGIARTLNELVKRCAGEYIAGVASDDYLLPDGILQRYLYLQEQHRRYTLASLELFRNLVEVRLPFIDSDFLTSLFHCPAPWRDGTAIHQAITGANRPALLRVRNANTGAPGNAGPRLEKVLDKFNSLFKRLDLYGYRHYHNFERWMQQRLIASVEAVLLDADSLSRGIYREATLRRLLAQTKSGMADHSYLFQILLILELWQRDNL